MYFNLIFRVNMKYFNFTLQVRHPLSENPEIRACKFELTEIRINYTYYTNKMFI